MINTTGWIQPFLAVIGIVIYFIKYRLNRFFFIPLLLIGMVIFHIFALYTGQTYIVNRYGLYTIAPIAFFVGMFIKHVNRISQLIVITLVIVQISILSLSEPASLEERMDSKYENLQEQIRVSQWLKDNPADSILISSFTGDNIIFRAQIPFRGIIYEGNGELWKQSLRDPAHFVRRIIFEDNPKVDPIKKEIVKNPQLLNNFTIIYDGKYYKVYDRIY